MSYFRTHSLDGSDVEEFKPGNWKFGKTWRVTSHSCFISLHPVFSPEASRSLSLLHIISFFYGFQCQNRSEVSHVFGFTASSMALRFLSKLSTNSSWWKCCCLCTQWGACLSSMPRYRHSAVWYLYTCLCLLAYISGAEETDSSFPCLFMTVYESEHLKCIYVNLK